MSGWRERLADEAATLNWGQRLGGLLPKGVHLHLQGTLGAGKTTLTRGVLRGLGHTGSVKSPTYTLVEPYELEQLTVYHFDLYRLGDPLELEYIGIRDYFSKDSIAIIEWPERGRGVLPEPDLTITMSVSGNARQLAINALSEAGYQVQQRLRAGGG